MLFFPHLLLLYVLSLDVSDSLDNESEKLGFYSRSSGTYYFHSFYFRFYESVVGVLGSGVFTPMGVDSKVGIFCI